jgi:hypothetical protein
LDSELPADPPAIPGQEDWTTARGDQVRGDLVRLCVAGLQPLVHRDRGLRAATTSSSAARPLIHVPVDETLAMIAKGDIMGAITNIQGVACLPCG